MNIISRSENNKIRLLTSSPLELLYAKLRASLDTELFSLFAKPTVKNHETVWSVEGVGVVTPVSRLGSEEKSHVADIINDRRQEILSRISSDLELRSVAEKLFIVPSDEEIFYYNDKNGNIVVTLAQWACTRLEYSSTPDPVSFFVDRAHSDRKKVEIRVSYSDGSVASSIPFIFDYNEVQRNLETDNNGCRFLGTLKINSQFVIKLDNNSTVLSQIFTVKDSEDNYEIVLCRKAVVDVLVVNEEGQPQDLVEIQYEYEGQINKVVTDKSGRVEVSELEAGKLIVISTEQSVNGSITHILAPDENQFQIIISEQKVAALRVITIYPSGETVPDFEFFLHTDSAEVQTCKTGPQGDFYMSPLLPDEKIRVSLHETDTNSELHLLREGENLVRLIVPQPLKPEDVRIILIDSQKKPVPSAGVDVALLKGNSNGVTDTNGIIYVPFNLFTDGENARTSIVLDYNVKNIKKNQKTIKKSFKFNSSQGEYIIQLRRKLNLWWLLLLLLPLILLIRCEKDVRVQVLNVDGSTTVQDITVNFEYTRAYLYDNGSFCTNERDSLEGKTGKDGVVLFENLGYSVYSWILYNFSKSPVYAHSTCVTTDTISPFFHYISETELLKVKVAAVPVATDFQVVDATDKQPLPGALVCIISEYIGVIQKDTVLTDSNGKIVMSKLPKCGRIIRSEASLDGYFPDSLHSKTVEDLITGKLEEKRVFSLRPVTDKIVFFVTNCKNKQPLPEATATLTFEYDNGLKKAQKINTNVNGIGKGAYDEAHVIAFINITGEKKYFKSGSLAGRYKVRDFNKLPDSLRTFCLEPEDTALDFVNVDEQTGKQMAGVKNTVTVSNSGKELKRETIISNKNGVFSVTGINFGDIISIHSSYPPNYLDNDYTIVNRDAISLLEGSADKRTIPLKPREESLKFRTLDADSGSLLGDAELSVTVNGSKIVSPDNSGSGEFIVKTRFSDVISVSAVKNGYEKNDSKIVNKAVSYLLGAEQKERDIPLKKIPKVRMEITIFNHNNAKDEVFELKLNGSSLGTITHTTDTPSKTTFPVLMEAFDDNIIELIFDNSSMTSFNTGSTLLIDPGGHSVSYDGDNQSFRFIFNISTGTLTGPEKF